MITYVGLLSFTDKGIQSIKDTTKRAAAAKEAAKKYGVNIREMLWTMGECDIVCVLEAEDCSVQPPCDLSSGGITCGRDRARDCVVGRRDGQDSRQAGVARRTPRHFPAAAAARTLRRAAHRGRSVPARRQWSQGNACGLDRGASNRGHEADVRL
jgi:hypothetical protein